MKKVIFSIIIFLAVFGVVNADYYSDNFDVCSILEGSSLIADDGEFIGYLSSNEYESKSISNDYGTYGNEYNSMSIWNDYGTYGNEYNSDSPWNEYSSTGPLILKNGKIYGRLTLNDYADGALNTFSVLRCFVPLSDDRYEPFMDMFDSTGNTSTYSTYSSYTPSTTSTKSCGVKSSKQSDGKCRCDTGYTWKDKDDSKNLDCTKKTIYNTCTSTKNIELGTDYKCYCKSGYKWNLNKNECLKIKTGIEICKESYGIYATSNNIKDVNGQYNCTCKTGYIWNTKKTSCIKKTTTCGKNSFSKEVGNCSCKEGYTWEFPNNSKNLDCIKKIIKSDKQIKLENKIDKVFDKIKIKFNKYSIEKKEKQYKGLLLKLEKLQKKYKTGDNKIIIDYLVILIKKELNIEEDLLGNLLDGLE